MTRPGQQHQEHVPGNWKLKALYLEMSTVLVGIRLVLTALNAGQDDHLTILAL